MNESTKIKLLAGLPLEFDNIYVPPLKLIQIADCKIKHQNKEDQKFDGYELYNYYLMNLTADSSDFNFNDDVDISKIGIGDIILSGMYNADDKYRVFIIDALEFFLQDEVRFIPKQGCFCIGKDENISILFKDNFEKFKEILIQQNCVNKNQDDGMKMANSKAEEIRQKILKGKSKLKNKKNEVTFNDLISVLASNGENGLNILNIWNLTIYQFQDQFARMQMIEDFDMNFRQLLAGAKKEDVDLKHYIRPITQDK